MGWAQLEQTAAMMLVADLVGVLLMLPLAWGWWRVLLRGSVPGARLASRRPTGSRPGMPCRCPPVERDRGGCE